MTRSIRTAAAPGRPCRQSFRGLAEARRGRAGFAGFEPDACLVNRYEPGARLTLHQDRNERDFGQPIVSVSLGLPAVFLFGGPKRSDRRCACRWCMATWSCGAGRRGCATTGCWR